MLNTCERVQTAEMTHRNARDLRHDGKIVEVEGEANYENDW